MKVTRPSYLLHFSWSTTSSYTCLKRHTLFNRNALLGWSLRKKVERYRQGIDKGVDEEFGRKDSRFSRIDKAPYYGAKISPASQTTYSGIKIDLKGRALPPEGKVIPELYANGEAAVQYGQGVSIGVILGKLTADTAADDIANVK